MKSPISLYALANQSFVICVDGEPVGPPMDLESGRQMVAWLEQAHPDLVRQVQRRCREAIADVEWCKIGDGRFIDRDDALEAVGTHLPRLVPAQGHSELIAG